MKNKNLKVSAIVPCYNSGLTIQRTIDSLKKQTWPNLEIIIIDDGSDDLLTKKILNFITDVKIVRKVNNGLASARNAGVKLSTGDLLFFLDSDDWIEKSLIELLVKEITKNENISFTFPGIKLEGEMEGSLYKNYNFFEQLFLNQIPYCILINKNIFNLVGGYKEDFKDGYEDWEFNIRLGLNGFFGKPFNKPYFHYQVSKNGMLLSNSTKKHAYLWSRIQKCNKEAFTINAILKTFQSWKAFPSTYNLKIYFFWLFLFKITPKSLFNYCFMLSKNFSHSRRVSSVTLF